MNSIFFILIVPENPSGQKHRKNIVEKRLESQTRFLWKFSNFWIFFARIRKKSILFSIIAECFEKGLEFCSWRLFRYFCPLGCLQHKQEREQIGRYPGDIRKGGGIVFVWIVFKLEMRWDSCEVAKHPHVTTYEIREMKIMEFEWRINAVIFAIVVSLFVAQERRNNRNACGCRLATKYKGNELYSMQL